MIITNPLPLTLIPLGSQLEFIVNFGEESNAETRCGKNSRVSTEKRAAD